MKPVRGYSIEGTIASIFFICLFVVVLIQIFGRTPIFMGPIWTEEAARWLWVWMVMIGIAGVERTDGQLRMGFLIEALPARGRVAVFTAIDIVYLGVVLHLIWIGWKTILRTQSNEAVTLPVSDAVLYASGFVAMILIANRIIRRLTGRGYRHAPDEVETPL